uniref:CUB domain-containing protein n=1 Tax=Panagrolaimus davidi TaxID=227884 RepID=A0A914R147_9BILA
MLTDCIPFILGICLYNCDTKNEIFMNLRAEAFFETNNYSQPYKNDLDKCNITFTFNDPDKEVQIIVIKTELFYDEKSALFLNRTTWDAYYTKTYSFKDHYPKKWEVPYTFYAQFGYISFEPKETPRCMVETKTPMFIYNELEIIFIQSDWMYLNIPSDSCHWKFETNETYGFKVMMKYYEPTLISSLQIKNSTDIFINKRSAKIQHPYYNSDNYLQIDVYKSENVSLRAFEATVTVVKKIKKQTNKCHVNDTDPNLITWNIDTLPDLFNIYCSYTLIVPNTNVEYDVNVANFPLERNADFLRYTYEDVDGLNTTVYVDGNIGNITWFTLLGYQNGSERRYFWEYELDGSFPSFGNKGKGFGCFQKIDPWLSRGSDRVVLLQL